MLQRGMRAAYPGTKRGSEQDKLSEKECVEAFISCMNILSKTHKNMKSMDVKDQLCDI